MKKTHVAEAWASFEKAVLKRTSEVQRTEMRRAFYAGAKSLIYIMVNGVSDGPDMTDEDDALMHTIDDELNEFVAKVGRGEA